MDKGEIDKILEKYGSSQSQIIAILHEIQDVERYLPEEDLRYVAQKLGMPTSQIYHIATFYKAFSLKPKGKHVCQVCMGTACHVRGAPLVLEELERKLGIKAGDTTEDLEFSIETVNCLGACALGPIVVVDGKYYGNMNPAKVEKMLKAVREGEAEAEKKEQKAGEKERPSVEKEKEGGAEPEKKSEKGQAKAKQEKTGKPSKTAKSKTSKKSTTKKTTPRATGKKTTGSKTKKSTGGKKTAGKGKKGGEK